MGKILDRTPLNALEAVVNKVHYRKHGQKNTSQPENLT